MIREYGKVTHIIQAALTTVKHIAVFTRCCKSLASLGVTPFFHVALYENFQKVETDATASGLSV